MTDGNVTKTHASYMWNVIVIKISSIPWHGAVDQDQRNKSHVLRCASQPPDWPCTDPPENAQLIWQECPLTLGSNLCSRCLPDLIMIVWPGGGYTTSEGWTGVSTGN